MKRTRDPSHILHQSSSSSDDDDSSTESGGFDLGKLRLEESDEDDDNSLQPPPQRKHFCVICRKQFSSGKAYGGHVRIHSSEYSNKGKKTKKVKAKKAKRTSGLVKREKEKETDLIRADVEGNIRCYICGKEFRTMPSLFGHMSSHPDRSWRGIRPPPPPPPDDDDHDHDVDVDDDAMSRSIMMSDVTEDVQKAAYCLMMLSYKDKAKRDCEMKDKGLLVDIKTKMEIDDVKLNNPKRSLGFDLNQPYHHLGN